MTKISSIKIFAWSLYCTGLGGIFWYFNMLYSSYLLTPDIDFIRQLLREPYFLALIITSSVLVVLSTLFLKQLYAASLNFKTEIWHVFRQDLLNIVLFAGITGLSIHTFFSAPILINSILTIFATLLFGIGAAIAARIGLYKRRWLYATGLTLLISGLVILPGFVMFVFFNFFNFGSEYVLLIIDSIFCHIEAHDICVWHVRGGLIALPLGWAICRRLEKSVSPLPSPVPCNNDDSKRKNINPEEHYMVTKRWFVLGSIIVLIANIGVSFFVVKRSPIADSRVDIIAGNRLDNLLHLSFAVACTNVLLDVESKRVRIYTDVPLKSSVIQINGFSIEIVSNPEFNDSECGAYYAHHNQNVARFAAVQCYEGDRELGRYILKTLAELCPKISLEDSAREDNRQTAQEILNGLDSKDSATQKILASEKEQWKFKIDRYRSSRPVQK